MKIGLLQVFKDKEQSYIASYPELQIYSYGKTIQEAMLRLKEIIKFYVQSAKEFDMSIEEICGISCEKTFLPSDRRLEYRENWIELEVTSNFN
ncbi:MAG: type II toxin-antitoxin system HicB family antitoxin [Nitrospirota bacterium]